MNNFDKRDRLFFGDQSSAAMQFPRIQSAQQLLLADNFCTQQDLEDCDAFGTENKKRLLALDLFFQGWGDIEKAKSVACNEMNIRQNLVAAVEAFNGSWGAFASQLDVAWQRVPSCDFREALVVNWIEQERKKGITRGHQVVLDLILHQIFVGGEVDPKANLSRKWLYSTFGQRIESLKAFNGWSAIDDFKLRPDYCKQLARSVCTPILLSKGDEGAVMWLTVDLFEDGMGALAPDIFSLGWSQIASQTTTSNTVSEDGEPNESQESVGILNSFDSVWQLSGLGGIGFSGRWRITNRPTVQCDALLLEDNIQYLSSYSGRSAECAMLVCLLAASGFVYEPVPSIRPVVIPPKVPLNTYFAATGTILPPAGSDLAQPLDVRKSRIGRVYAVDRKCGSCSQYKLQPGNKEESPLIDTIVISQGDYDCEKGSDTSPIHIADRENRSKSYRGIHFQPCKTVQETLNWMLSVNQWKRIWNEAKLQAWEKQWDVVRNEFGQPISREMDDEGNHIVVSEEEGISTGSIEYMRSPFGGAKKPETVHSTDEEASDDDDEVIPAE